MPLTNWSYLINYRQYILQYSHLVPNLQFLHIIYEAYHICQSIHQLYVTIYFNLHIIGSPILQLIYDSSLQSYLQYQRVIIKEGLLN